MCQGGTQSLAPLACWPGMLYELEVCSLARQSSTNRASSLFNASRKNAIAKLHLFLNPAIVSLWQLDSWTD